MTSTAEINALILDAKLSMEATINAIERNEDSALFLDAAVLRVREFTALATLANNEPWPFRKELRPLTTEITEGISVIETRMSREITIDDKAEINAQMAIREDGLFRLDAARINSLLALVHMSAALDAATPQPAKLKAV